MAEKSNEQLVRLLIGAAFHEGTLEHRDSPSYATLQKARNAVETAQAAVLARMAGPGEVVVPQRPDRGPFEWCGDDGDFIVSRDFTYDAGLKLSGDFPDDETKRAYMQRVMDILNAARPNQGGNACRDAVLKGPQK